MGLSKENLENIKIITALFLISISITVAVRYFIYDDGYFKISDESHYTYGLSDFSKNPTFSVSSSIISGLGYIVILSSFKFLTGLSSLETMNIFSTLISFIYLPVLFGLFNTIFKNKKFALLSSIGVLLTSYFIEPMLEGRPQQIGMILFLFYFVLFYKYLENNTNRSLYAILCIVTSFAIFIFHILSSLFLFLTFLIVSCVLFCQNRIRIRDVYLLLTPFFISLLYFLSGRSIFGPNIFYATSGGIQWTFQVSSNVIFQYFGNHFRTLAPVGLSATYLLLPVILLLLRYIYEKSNSLQGSFKHMLQEHRAISTYLLFSIALIFIIIQAFYLPFEVSTYHSTYLLLFMQSGNLLFGLCYISGIVRLLGLRNVEDSTRYVGIISVSLLILTGITILLSKFMGWGQINFGLRFINYWTIFASPIIIFELTNSKIRYANKLLLVLFTVSVIVISTLTAAQAPQILDIKNYWPHSTENALDRIRATWDKNDTIYILPQNTFTMREFILYYRSEYSMNNLKSISEQRDDSDLIYNNGLDYVYK